jgi:processive 1,2-diacylglycerol beta-glucosyltransferase/1,2-diacylglycerol 3-beta-galactosyltransferase
MKETYLFFYLNTGGGHLAPARAVAAQFDQYYKDSIQILLVDGFANAPKAFKDLIEKGYRFLQSHMPWFYEFLYAMNKMPTVSKRTTRNISRFIEKDFEKWILRQKPAKIVLFHFFLIEPTLNVIKKHNLNIPVVITVTDPITPPPIWFFKNEADYIVFSEEAKASALKRNISENKINIFPFVLQEKYSQEMDRKEIKAFKASQNLSLDKPLVLIIGGADGLAKGRKLLKRLVQADLAADLAVVCGKNAKLYKQCMKIKKKNPESTIQVYGFIDFVYELINCADLVISKGGASTFMEILISKKIPVINSYLWEQERGNVDYITNNRLGVYETSPRKIAEFCKATLQDENMRLHFKENIEKANLENGGRRVADFIKNYKGIKK